MPDLRNASRVGRLSFLTEEQKRDLYLAALEILAHIGMRVGHPEAQALLLAAGAGQTTDGRLLLPRHMVETARRSVPPVVNVYDRTGTLAMELGGYNSYFGTGSDLMSTYDLETREHRPSTLEDVRRAARLSDALPHMDFVMSSAHPRDRDPHQSYLLSFQAMCAHTTKPLVVTAENDRDLAVMVEIARALRGWGGRPPPAALLRRLHRAHQPPRAPGGEPGQAPPLRGEPASPASTRPRPWPGRPPPSPWPATPLWVWPRASSAWCCTNWRGRGRRS